MLESFSAGLLESKEGERDALKEFQRAAQANTELDKDRHSLVEQGKACILDWVSRGAMRAFGFEKPRAFDDLPVELKSKHFDATARFNWETGELRSHGLHIIEVRFIAAKRAERLIETWAQERAGIESNPEAKAKGRPSMQKHILDAFDALLESGQIDLDGPMRSNFINIRQWLAAHSSGFEVDEETPNDETIRRYVSPLIKQARKSKKQ